MKDSEPKLDIKQVGEIISGSLQKHTRALALLRSMCQQYDMRARPELVGEDRKKYFGEMANELESLSEGTIVWPAGTLMKLFPDGTWQMTHSVKLNESKKEDPQGTIRGMFLHLDIGFSVGCFIIDYGLSRNNLELLTMKEREEILRRFDENHVSDKGKSMDDFFALVTEDEGLINVNTTIPSMFSAETV